MKRVYIAATVLLIVGVVWFLFVRGTSPITNYPATDGTIVAFGDSLVFGYGASPGNDFVSLLEREIGEPILNLGVNGDTTRDGLDRIDDVLAEDPKLVIVLLGGNDALQQIPDTETFANLGAMIEQLHAAGSMVLLLGVRGGLLTDSYARQYELLAETHNTGFVPDVLDGLFGRSQYMADAIHPNDAGYAIIAERVTAEVAPLLVE